MLRSGGGVELRRERSGTARHTERSEHQLIFRAVAELCPKTVRFTQPPTSDVLTCNDGRDKRSAPLLESVMDQRLEGDSRVASAAFDNFALLVEGKRQDGQARCADKTSVASFKFFLFMGCNTPQTLVFQEKEEAVRVVGLKVSGERLISDVSFDLVLKPRAARARKSTQ